MTSITTATTDRKRLGRIQRRRKLAIAIICVVVAASIPFVQSSAALDGLVHEGIEIVGLMLIGAAILGRAWCTLYIGGRKADHVVDTGPYSVCRNPLYVFSILGAAGVGAQSGSVTLALVFGLGYYLVFLPVVLGEERVLQGLLGTTYADYRARVPRFLPRRSAWRDMETIEVRPRLLMRTLRDGAMFFLVVPFFELSDLAQSHHLVEPVLRLP